MSNKIVYIDDSIDRKREDIPPVGQSFNEIGQLCLDKDGNAADDLISDVFQDAVCVLLHESMKDSNSSGLVIDSHRYVGKIKSFCRKRRLPIVRFSGGMYESRYYEASNSGEMIKEDFYKGLADFVNQYIKFGEIDIKGLVEGKYTTRSDVGQESSPGKRFFMCPGNVNINDVDCLEAFVESIRPTDYDAVVFDLDAMDSDTIFSPAKVRFLSLYLRLSVATGHKQGLLPIIYTGRKDATFYFKKFKDKGCADIFATKGMCFSNDISYCQIDALTSADFCFGFLSSIKVTPKATIGNHALGNYWGAFVMARHIKGFDYKSLYREALRKDPLYLKYLLASRISTPAELENILAGFSSQEFKCVEIANTLKYDKVLLIDDQDDVWEPVIRALLPNAQIDIIGKSNGLLNDDKDKNFLSEKALKIIRNSKVYSVILLDLRLGGPAEENIINGDECSGMRILNEIIKSNAAQKVIMFTSSNKAWNLRKALSKAIGYYVKESPMQIFKEDETLNNLNQLIETIEHSCECHELVGLVDNMKSFSEGDLHINHGHKYIISKGADTVLKEVQAQLMIVISMVISKSREIGEANWNYEYIALFQVLEIVKRLNAKFDSNSHDDSLKYLVRGITQIKESEFWEITVQRKINMRNSLIHVNNDIEQEDVMRGLLELWNRVIYPILNDLVGE